MKWSVGLSTGACTERPIAEVLQSFRGTGVRGVELGTPPKHFNPWRTAQVEHVADQLRQLDIQAVSIHAPFGGLLDLADTNPHHRHAAIGAILMAASALKQVGGRIVVVHPSDLPRDGRDVAACLASCVQSLAVLADGCRHEGVTLAIESPLPHLVGGHPDEFAAVLKRLDDRVAVCLDTGHTTLGGFWDRFLAVADGRVVHVHASDNQGTYDDHLPPGDGRLDWRHIATTLESANFDGWIMLELKCPRTEETSYFKRALERTEAVLIPE